MNGPNSMLAIQRSTAGPSQLSGCVHSDRAALLEAFPAVHRATLCGLERNGRFLAALRADRFRFNALNGVRTRIMALAANGLTGFAAFRLVLKTLVGEKHLLAGCEHKFRAALRTLQDFVMVFHTPLPSRDRKGDADRGHVLRRPASARGNSRELTGSWAPDFWERCLGDGRLVLFTPLLFTETLTREGFLGSTPFAGLHVVAVFLDLLDDVLSLDLPFEAAESVFQRLTLLNNNFCHAYSPPFPLFVKCDRIDALFYPESLRTGKFSLFPIGRLPRKSRFNSLKQSCGARC
jgi:hypothetical protein